MSEIQDTYKTLSHPVTEIIFKEKNSKFIGFAYPVQTEEEIKLKLEEVKKLHYSARHWCYAYQIGIEKIKTRANDDGEPNNSAGMPLLGQIQSFGLTNVLVIVVRYFGGVKLGVGGLVSAYKTTAQQTLLEAQIVEKYRMIDFVIQFGYPNMNKVMRLIKEKNLTIRHQEMNETCQIYISVRKKHAQNTIELFENLHEITLKKIDNSQD